MVLPVSHRDVFDCPIKLVVRAAMQRKMQIATIIRSLLCRSALHQHVDHRRGGRAHQWLGRTNFPGTSVLPLVLRANGFSVPKDPSFTLSLFHFLADFLHPKPKPYTLCSRAPRQSNKGARSHGRPPAFSSFSLANFVFGRISSFESRFSASSCCRLPWAAVLRRPRPAAN